MPTASTLVSSRATRLRRPVHVPARLVRGVVRCIALLPLALRVEWLQWLRRDMGPTHPCVGEILLEISELQAASRGPILAGWAKLARIVWRLA